eukprot:TRINITY_DN100754_c0_g1_i1.p1 TRINITY_DN100754_c0_g1~~TRINITY_DN100754_c0_g1_i1.p1  ORF type:complete len:573 (+),score=76.57 TRINITY_DN100754_c0_g1_i1:76-1794(+)
MQEPRTLEEIEVRPVQTVPGDSRLLDAVREQINERSATRTPIGLGEIFVVDGQEFAVSTCTPLKRGIVDAANTNIRISTGPVIPVLKRVQLTYLSGEGDPEDEDHSLYEDYVKPQLLRLRDARHPGGRCLQALALDQVWHASDKEFGVRALDPTERIGALDVNTAVFTSYIETPSFSKIHVLPYRDTLPNAYTYNLFRDFLQPFFQAHPFSTYSEGDVFTYRGVRFRLMATEPASSTARISSLTIVYFEGEPLQQTIWEIIPPELRDDLRRLPRGLQMLLLNTMANEEAVAARISEVHDVLRPGQGLDRQDVQNCGNIITWNKEEQSGNTQSQCMVCLGDFDDGDNVRVLPCDHAFHKDCIDEWLSRSTHCPICKRKVYDAEQPEEGGPRRGMGVPIGRGPLPPETQALRSGMTSGLAMLIGCPIICVSRQKPGTVVGLESANTLRVSLEGETEEAAVPSNDVVQTQRVELTGLTRISELNGQMANIVGFDGERERYQVSVLNRVIAVRPENCILPEGCAARVTGLQAPGRSSLWNGHYGRVVGFDRSRVRHVLSMAPRGQLLSVKLSNLRL